MNRRDFNKLLIANLALFYRLKPVQASNDLTPLGDIEDVKITTTFNLEQCFEVGQIYIYQNIEEYKPTITAKLYYSNVRDPFILESNDCSWYLHTQPEHKLENLKTKLSYSSDINSSPFFVEDFTNHHNYTLQLFSDTYIYQMNNARLIKV